MNSIFLKITLGVTILFICNYSFAQMFQDTIYFDYKNSVCEKPVAEYYRVCTLNKEKSVYYKGDVKDYYADGTIEMTGSYNNNGLRDGLFVFYNSNGNVLKKGTFADDVMKGIWDFNFDDGKLMAEFKCVNEWEFTPLQIISANGDTLLKNGTGNFSIDINKDVPGLFNSPVDYKISGEVMNGEYDGTLYYVSNLFGKEFTSTEIFNKGKFKNAKQETFSLGMRDITSPLHLLNLMPANLSSFDKFYHQNLLFGIGLGSEQALINFLLTGEAPEITSDAHSFSENVNDIYPIIQEVMNKYLPIPEKNRTHEVRFKINAAGVMSKEIELHDGIFEVSAFRITKKDDPPAQLIHSDITLTIDNTGYIINTAFTGNLNPKEITEMNYYFSRLAPLKPFIQGGEKLMTNLKINLYTLTDTLKGVVDTINYYYLAAASDIADSVKYTYNKKFSNRIYDKVEIEAKFPGGPPVWQKYLERNLNSNVAIMHGAPNGYYTVIVSFLVDEEGNISEVKDLFDPGYGTAQEAVRVIENGPRWIPAVQDGKNVKYRQKQSITFAVSRE